MRAKIPVLISILLVTPTSGIFAGPASELFSTSSTQYEHVRVERIVSTDTLVLENGVRVKMIGLKAPEPPRKKERIKYDSYGFAIEKPENPLTTVEENAFRFVEQLLNGKYAGKSVCITLNDSGLKYLSTDLWR